MLAAIRQSSAESLVDASQIVVGIPLVKFDWSKCSKSGSMQVPLCEWADQGVRVLGIGKTIAIRVSIVHSLSLTDRAHGVSSLS